MFSVLYVDDERDLLDLCKIFLEQSPEFNVKTAASGREALELLSTLPFDAIISDYQMPGMDGIALLKTVRQQFGDIPFILFTGRGREEIVIEAINNGADFYLQKGGDVKAQFAELAHKIRQATARRQAEISRVESEKRLADIIDFLPDATFAINRDGVIIAWNRAIEEMTGLSAETMLGKGDHEYSLPFYGKRRPILIDLIFSSESEVEPYYSNILRVDNTITAETNLPHPRGNQITVLAKAGPLYNRQGELAGAIEAIRDITERKKADDELRAAYEQITASEEELREQLDALTLTEQQVRENASRLEYMLGFFERANNPEKDLLKYAVEGAGIVTGSPLGYLAFLSEDESELSMYAWSKSAMKECALREKPIVYKTSETGLWGEAVRQRRPVITNDYAAPNPQKKGYPSGHPVIVRHMNIPVIDNGRIVMVAGVANKPHDYTVDDVHQLSLLMQGLWQVIRQRRTRNELLESEENYRSLFENSVIGIFRTTLDGRFLAINTTLARIFGYDTPQEMLNAVRDIGSQVYVNPDDRQRLIKTLGNEGVVKDFEAGVYRRDGNTGWIKINAAAVFDVKGNIRYYEGTAKDVTEQKNTKDALDREKIFSDAVMDSVPGLLYLYDSDGRLVRWNRAHEAITGYTAEELRGMHVLDWFTKDENAIRCISEGVERALAKGQAWAEADLQTRDGRRIPFHFTAKRLEIGGKTYFTGIGIDISDRMKSEQELRAAYEQITASEEELRGQFDVLAASEKRLQLSEERLSLALEAADEGLWDWDLATNKAYFSPQYYRMLGYEPGAFDGSYDSWRALVHPDDLEHTENVIRTSIQERKSFDLEFRLRMQDGSWKWILGRGKVVEENERGEPVRMAGTHVDISGRREIEEELRESTAELDRYFTASLDLLCIADTDGYFRKLNPQWEPTLGYTITELAGKRFLDLVHPDDLQGTLDAIATLRSQEDVLNFTNRYRHKDGTYRWIEWRSKPSGDLIYAAARDITHHREAEDALRQSEEKYRTILNNIQDVYYRSDREGNLIMASPSILPLLGYQSLDELLGKNFGTDIWAFPERREAFLDLIKKEGEVKDFEVSLRRSDGGLVIVSTSSHFYSGQDGKPGGIEGIFHDITAVRNADQQMQLLAGLMEISPASITVHADDGRFLYANQRTFELHGYTREEFLALNLHELDVPASEERINERIDTLKQTGEASFDVEHYRKDGSRIPLHVAIRLIHWNAQDAILSVATDLSERKKAEQALHDMERLYRIIVDNSHDVIYTLKPDGTLTFISRSWSVCLGHDQGEVLGKSFREFVHPEDIPACEDFLARTISSCKAQPGIEYRVFHKDGTIHWYRTTLMPVIDDTGAVTTLVGNALDFTGYRLAEEALRKSEARYRSVIEKIQDAFIRSDQKGKLIMASPSAATLFGYDVPEEILERSITSFYQRPEIWPGLIEKMEQEKELVDQNIEFMRKDGTTFWGSVNAHFVYNAEGEPDGVECSIHDVSEYRAMEQAIREANRKLSLLNSITRHDVANQLTILQGFARIAAQRKGDPVVEDYLKKILAASDTIARQIEFTRTYQELGIQAPSWIPVEAVIERVASQVPIRFSKTCAGIEVFSDPMLERVFFNLVENARRHGGRVTGITIRCEREPDGLLVIVEDNGIGIPLGEKEKIFTRGYGKNTGLGLFLAREILSITNISIRETGIEGRGARFEMLVPKNAFRVTAAKGR
ncbi:MAG TPA: PAS domain S-box protein [Methanoregula sp.]|nr:PAS domain S-box protein [Methanoregula sp.]